MITDVLDDLEEVILEDDNEALKTQIEKLRAALAGALNYIDKPESGMLSPTLIVHSGRILLAETASWE